MEWRDIGYVLAARRHGEADAILTLLTRQHGRHLGLVKGGASRAKRPDCEIGNLVSAQWRARLSEQLGNYRIEPMHATAAGLLDDAARLAALLASCAVLDIALPEREPHGELFESFAGFVEKMAADEKEWPKHYVLWEADLLTGLGFGLDLRACAVTGANEGLTYVSPRTGRAASKEGAKGYEERLLKLPRFLIDATARAQGGDIIDGLTLTGFFLRSHVLEHAPSPVGFAARDRLVEILHRIGA